MVIAQIMSSKRFTKAVQNKTKIPETLINDLKEALETCKEFTLQIPGELQSHALTFCGPSTD